MPKKENLKSSPRRSNGRRKGEEKGTKFGRDLIAGMKQIAAHVRGEIELPVRHYPGPVDVKAVRKKTGMSQSDFAGRYGINLRTLQEWEQGRAEPDMAVRAYLTVIDRNREAVEAALSRR